MRPSYFLSTIFLAASSLAAPIIKAENGTESGTKNIDGTIFNFALTLEHLESAFYQQALSKFTADDFTKANLSASLYNNLQEVHIDEATHVVMLTSALIKAGVAPVQPCTYQFPLDDVQTFVATSSVLEGVGVTAYLGAASLITNKDFLTAAGSILTVEARHNTFVRANKWQVPVAAAFDTPLGINQVFTLAAAFIKSCPSTNMDLGVKAFPALLASSAAPYMKGAEIMFNTPSGMSANCTAMRQSLWVAWPTVMGPIFEPALVMSNGSITSIVPPGGLVGPTGQAYAILTSANTTEAFSDKTTVAGPAIVEISSTSPQGSQSGQLAT